MPLSLTLAHKLNKKMADCRRDGSMAWLRPDSKTQVCIDTTNILKWLDFINYFIAAVPLGDSTVH